MKIKPPVVWFIDSLIALLKSESQYPFIYQNAFYLKEVATISATDVRWTGGLKCGIS